MVRAALGGRVSAGVSTESASGERQATHSPLRPASSLVAAGSPPPSLPGTGAAAIQGGRGRGSVPAGQAGSSVVCVHRLRWIVGAIGLVLVGVALWMAVGPWTVHVYGQSYGCGSPFMGRYLGSHGDPGARAAYACLEQAANRRTLALGSGGLGAVLLVVAMLGLRRGKVSDHPRVLTAA